MKRYGTLGGLVLAAAIWSLASIASAQVACTQTGFFVDGINMTAAEINPGNVTGTVDATGCNIGVYYDDGTDGGTVVGGTVNSATIGAPASEAPNYFGIVVNGRGNTNALTVNVTGTTISKVGDPIFNGSQHGNAIFYINASTAPNMDDSRTCNATISNVTGTISENTISGYQKAALRRNVPESRSLLALIR